MSSTLTYPPAPITTEPAPIRRASRDERARALWSAAAGAEGQRREEILDRLIELYLPIARSLARRYRARGINAEDLEQVAALGLVKAVRGFDPDRGHAFLSYATPTITGELRRHFRDSGWAVRPPRRLQELRAAITDAREALFQLLRRDPTPRELAKHLDRPPSEIREALATDGAFSPTSIDAGVRLEEDTAPLAETLGAEDPGFERIEQRLLLRRALRRLSPRDRRIVSLRFVHRMTQREIGEQLGVTQMQVSRLLARILRDLRSELTRPANA